MGYLRVRVVLKGMFAVLALLILSLGGFIAFVFWSDPPAPIPQDFGDFRNHPAYPITESSLASVDDSVIVENNVPILTRDGTILSARVFRPSEPGHYPVVMSFTAYGKDIGPSGYPPHLANALRDDFDLGSLTVSPWTTWEGPDPAFWVPNGYVVVYVDSRGYFGSEGDASVFGDQDGDDFYDAIEWAGQQLWSNGNVGTSGVSYLAIAQWVAATNQPPSLKAIIPWEGQSDSNRDVLYHGGIPETVFTRFWFEKLESGAEKSPVPPGAIFRFAHPYPRLLNRFRPKQDIILEKIEVPALIAATWSDHGLHTRGSFEAFKRIQSKQKWLFNHGRQKWSVYYSEEALDYQLRFFDYFLKGENNGWAEQPQVRYEVRDTLDQYEVFSGRGWPLEGTDFQKMYLDANSGRLLSEAPEETGQIEYEAQSGQALFNLTFEEDTRLVGNMKLRLWISTDAGRDIDLFIGIKKFDQNNAEVTFFGKLGYTETPVAMGWLRVSERLLDEGKSTPWQPVLAHEERAPVKTGEIYPVDIEILPSGTLFRAGESLQLVVQGKDLFDNHPSLGHHHQVNEGNHTIYTGDEYGSYLLIPVIP